MTATWHVERWWKSRNFLRLLLGLPALLIVAAWLVLCVFLVGPSKERMESRYSRIGATALAAQNFKLARLAYVKLVKLNTATQKEYEFRLARALLGMERANEALQLYQALAPSDRAGYLPAHLQLAGSLVRSPTRQNLELAENHLLNVVAADPTKIEAHELLGKIYFDTGRLELAKRHFAACVKDYPDINLMLAATCGRERDMTAARLYARRAADFYEGAVATMGTNNPIPRLRWADALVMLNDYTNAYAVLKNGWEQWRNPAYLPAMADACGLWASSLATNNAATLPRRLQLVQEGLAYMPQHETLLRQLIDLSNLNTPEGAAARTRITGFLADGKAGPILHLCLGIDAHRRGDREKARTHFEIAYKLAPQVPRVANNMAMILAQDGPNQAKRALEIVQMLLDQRPNDPNFRETRGQVLLRLGKYEEAVTDLEFALAGESTHGPETHQALALAYQQLGMKELAAEHEKRAKEPDRR